MEHILTSSDYSNIIQTFFALIYNEQNSEFLSFQNRILFDKVTKESLDLYTIILICNARNFKVYQKLPLIQEKVHSLLHEEPTLQSMQKLQTIVLQILIEQNSLKMAEDIIRRIALIRNEGILEYDEEQKIRSVIRQIRPQSKTVKPLKVLQDSKQDYFKEQIKDLSDFILEHRLVFEHYSFTEEMSNVITLLQGGRFSIGVTGVMSAGKSTLLNALLGREILGTSVIPETANLTVLKYAQEEKGVIHFWTQEEWGKIEASSQFDEGIAFFIQETKERFSDKLKEYITTEGKRVEIPIDQITQYTSAKNSSKMCNLIKYVELYLPLEFLRDGVELVDTPGLDDPLTQREEITKNYLSHCDVIMHLMNAAQSATQKDLDFIIDALVNKHISSVFIVLTHADTVSQKDLEAVMQYTQTSFQNRLRELQLSESFEKIIQEIEFLPTAGYMALLHKIGRSNEALDKGYKLEDTGIFEVEGYLNKILFGQNSQKGKVILRNACRSSMDIFDKILLEIDMQRNLLQENQESLEAKIHANKVNEEKACMDIEAVKMNVQHSLKRLQDQIDLLKKGVHFKILEYEEVVKDRILNLFRYAYDHNTKPSEDSLYKTVMIGIQDGTTEAKRDYYYKLERAIHFFFEEIKELISGLKNIQMDMVEQSIIDTQEQVKTFLAHTPFIEQTTVLQQGITQLNKQHSSLPSIKPELDRLFHFSFEVLVQRSNEWASGIKKYVLHHLEDSIEVYYMKVQDTFRVERDALLEALKERQNQSLDDYEKRLIVEEEKLIEGKMFIDKILKEVL